MEKQVNAPNAMRMLDLYVELLVLGEWHRKQLERIINVAYMEGRNSVYKEASKN